MNYVSRYYSLQIKISIMHKKKGSSTTLCLLDLIHNWLSKMDNPGHYLRACFLDFSKAFDRIDHNIVITKLIDLGVRRSLISWICSFLSNRRQCVKLGQCMSRWLSTSAGVPQGTKLGPILFVMINDLKIVSPRSSNWKYVDDVTISEIVPTREVSILQNELDTIGNWTSTNNMKLNPKKCKEMIVSFRRDIEQPPPTLVVENISLERIESHKVLGLTIQNNLKWDLHISEIVTKASKRLHILRVLKRSGVSPFHLLRVYFALIRSLLEYCCPVWHSSLTINLSDKIERVQKRTMRIIYPTLSYDAALDQAKCSTLRARRDGLCIKTFDKMRQPDSRLNHLIPPSRANEHNCNLRYGNRLTLFPCKTERFKKSFFPTMCTQSHNL